MNTFRSEASFIRLENGQSFYYSFSVICKENNSYFMASDFLFGLAMVFEFIIFQNRSFSVGINLFCVQNGYISFVLF